MPEEINRLVTDRLADLLLTPSPDGDENLLREGVEPHRIQFVGNVMVDTLLHALQAARASGFRATLGLKDESYALVTLHRPSNVDIPERLNHICRSLGEIAEHMAVIFPMHPRTRSRLTERDRTSLGKVTVLDPTPYHATLDLTASARVVITDSGGLQEETTALGVPCLTLRDNTERPITVTEGTNQLVLDLSTLVEKVLASRRGNHGSRPNGWDGHAGQRVAEALVNQGSYRGFATSESR